MQQCRLRAGQLQSSVQKKILHLASSIQLSTLQYKRDMDILSQSSLVFSHDNIWTEISVLEATECFMFLLYRAACSFTGFTTSHVLDIH